MSKVDRCFVRNQGYTRSKVCNIERHNERKNQHYGNSDVVAERAGLNVYYKRCDDTYLGAFDRMVKDGTISTWNLKRDPKIIDEFIFDVNTEYFDRHGGYEYAKQFYEEAYRFAVAEAGGEEFVLSAVMHADERNKALSEQLGRNVYHYHLHVMYVPVVDAEIKWTKRCKNPSRVLSAGRVSRWRDGRFIALIDARGKGSGQRVQRGQESTAGARRRRHGLAPGNGDGYKGFACAKMGDEACALPPASPNGQMPKSFSPRIGLCPIYFIVSDPPGCAGGY